MNDFELHIISVLRLLQEIPEEQICENIAYLNKIITAMEDIEPDNTSKKILELLELIEKLRRLIDDDMIKAVRDSLLEI